MKVGSILIFPIAMSGEILARGDFGKPGEAKLSQ